MFEIMMNCIEMAKEEVVWILVFMQTGMGHNYVFENTSEMAALGRAWLDTQSMVDAFCNAAPAFIGCMILFAMTAMATIKLTRKYVFTQTRKFHLLLWKEINNFRRYLLCWRIL